MRTLFRARRPAPLALLLAVAAGAAPAAAQTKVGTTIVPFLQIEPSARAAALGGTGVATASELLASYQNPGALGHLGATGAQFTHLNYYAGVRYDHAVAAVAVPIGNLFLTTTYLNSGDIAVRTVEQPEGTGEQYAVTDLALGAGFARRFTDRFAAGVTAHYVRETVWHSSLSAVSFGAGVLYRLPFGADLGASLTNFGTRGQFDGRDLIIRYDADPTKYGDNSGLPAALVTEDYPLPVLFRVGLAYPLRYGPDNALRLSLDAQQPSDNTPSVSVGGEYRFRDLLALRAGYERLGEQDSEKGLTLGGGLAYATGASRLSFDYAWTTHQALGNPQRFTLGVQF